MANALQLPVVTTLMGKGAFPASNPLNMGPGRHARLEVREPRHDGGDLIIAGGARFSDRVTGRLDEFAPHADVIHIDIDPAEIGKVREVQIPIVGDLRGVLAGINEAACQGRRQAHHRRPGSPRSPSGAVASRSTIRIGGRPRSHRA